jgi:hypothetical protein
VQNTTGGTLTNLQIHAYTKSGNSQNTALKSISSFGGNTSQANLAVPRHGVTCAAGVVPLQPQANKADVQVYSSSEMSTRTTSAGTNLSSNERLLGYGYLVRQTAAQSVSDTDSRTLANTESGQVTVSLRVPYNASNSAYNFVMTFLLFTDSSRELVQFPEDVFYSTTAGVNGALPDGASRVSVLGGAACGLTGNNRFQSNISITNNGTTQTFDPELNAPSFSVVPSSTNLQTAIGTASSGNTLCCEGTRSITNSLTVGQNLSLMAGENAVLQGTISNQNGILNISAGQVKLYGVTIQDGYDSTSCNIGGIACGGGIKNQGTLLLFASKIQNNRASGWFAAFGGGIYNQNGNLTLEYTRIENNVAQGENVLSGKGSYAVSGGIYNEMATVLPVPTITIKASLVSGNSAIGGDGGDGFDADDSSSPDDGFCDIEAENGGNGGDAYGGGVYRATSPLIGSSMVTGNTVMGGFGGLGGSDGGWADCFPGSVGSVGASDKPNFGP